jgi:hypothetical protein
MEEGEGWTGVGRVQQGGMYVLACTYWSLPFMLHAGMHIVNLAPAVCLHAHTEPHSMLPVVCWPVQIDLQRRLFAEARARSMNMDAQAEANVQAALFQQQQVAAALTAAHAQTAAAAEAAGDDSEDYDD